MDELFLKGSSKKSGSGLYAHYYILNDKSRGIKLFKDKFTTFNRAMKSTRHASALLEYFTMAKASKRVSIVPKPYGVYVILFRNFYRVGILMQHISGISLEKKLKKEKKHIKGIHFDYPIIQKLKVILKKKGIFHYDLHDDNIIYSKGKYWVIDWDFEEISFREKKWKTNIMKN